VRNHGAGDWRGRGPAVLAGVLGEDGDGDLGIPDRRKGDEQGVVLTLARHAALLGALGAELPDLRGPGLAADLDGGEARLCPCRGLLTTSSAGIWRTVVFAEVVRAMTGCSSRTTAPSGMHALHELRR
jgi:hypothetical protein